MPPALNDDNGVMLLIPPGPFVHGPDKSPGVAPAFYIDRTEVTNRMYAAFCQATKRPLPPGFPENKPNLPVVNVTIEDAATFAKYAGKRLPDALEWEKAYRGSEGRLYPWGNDADPAKANIAGSKAEPIIADALPEGGSPYNILQMAGNVREFTRTINAPTAADIERMAKLISPPPTAREAWYGVRGGSFSTPLDAALPWKYEAVPASYRASDVGFRCVKDPPRR